MLKARIQSGVVISVALLAAALWLPPGGVLVVLLVVSAVALWEFYSLLTAAGIPHFRFVGLLGGLALITATWLSFHVTPPIIRDTDWIVLFLVTAAVFVRQFPQKNNPRPLVTVAGTLMGVMYVPFLFNFFTKLLMAWGDMEGRLLVLYLIVVVKFNDIGAYFVGCAVGRHKLFPRISPAKTWEGFFGGMGAGMAGSVVFFLSSHGEFGALRMTLLDAVALGVLLSVAGTVGDLTESLFKRAAGLKDSGRIIMGMGGLLDVIDSLLFAAPSLYLYSRFFLDALP